MQTLVPFMRERQGDDTPFALFRAERNESEYQMKRLNDPVAAISSNFEVR
jgi:hypothetical protein